MERRNTETPTNVGPPRFPCFPSFGKWAVIDVSILYSHGSCYRDLCSGLYINRKSENTSTLSWNKKNKPLIKILFLLLIEHGVSLSLGKRIQSVIWLA